MTDIYLHEAIYRGRPAVEKLGQWPITICGAGALGSLLADNLARQGVRQLSLIDFDRVESHNAGTQLYGESDVGAKKVDVLRNHLFRSVGVEAAVFDRRLDERTVKKLLRGARLVVDTFDNAASRRLVADYCRQRRIACLHLGMNADYGEARWNEVYQVPADVVEGDVCDYPLARNLILLVVAAGSEAVLRYILDGRKENYAVTLRDLVISRQAY
ncbi:MAG: ThiF family adenylyltransferase [Chloroflexota bacterium]|nr:MAG: ThiF family adenylyltransferase [Chloroflexota bacterium]